MRFRWNWASNSVLPSMVLLLMAGCATMPAPEPAPDPIERLDIEFTEGVPEEQPLPPLRTEGLTEDEVTTVRVYRERHRAVTNITALGAQRTRGRSGPFAGTGSGFLIDGDGIIVTNHHVIDGAQHLIITLYDGSHYRGELVGSDPEMDLAVVRFDPQGRSLHTIPPGNSSRLQVGQKVLALGNPFGLDGTLTTGVISALERPIETRSGFIMRDLIQTDAAINPGNSGGPLLNTRGEYIGVNSMMVSPQMGSVGIGLAVPVDTVQRITRQIIDEGRVVRGWIDIEGIALNDRLARAGDIAVNRGILVTRVIPGGNAEDAGLRGGEGGRSIRHGPYRIPVDGDIIQTVNDERTNSVAELLASLEATRPNDRVALGIVRDGQRRTIEITLGERPRRAQATEEAASPTSRCGPLCRMRLRADGGQQVEPEPEGN